MKYQLTVYGKPTAQGRPRFNSFSKSAYDPQPSREAKQKIAKEAIESKQVMLPADTPLRASFKIYVPLIVSWSKKKKAELIGKPVTAKSDLSNYIKLIEDALNGIAYPDDSAIVCYGECFKVYSEKPRVEILIESLDSSI